jgi:hypothetical protein
MPDGVSRCWSMQQRHSGSHVFDQDRLRGVPRGKICDLPAKIGVLEPVAKDVDQIVIREPKATFTRQYERRDRTPQNE